MPAPTHCDSPVYNSLTAAPSGVGVTLWPMETSVALSIAIGVAVAIVGLVATILYFGLTLI